MSNTQQPEALRLVEWIESDMSCDGDADIVAELLRQHALIEELESQLSAIGAGEAERIDVTVFKRLLNDYADCLRNGDVQDAGAAFVAVVAEYQQAARRAPVVLAVQMPEPAGWLHRHPRNVKTEKSAITE